MFSMTGSFLIYNFSYLRRTALQNKTRTKNTMYGYTGKNYHRISILQSQFILFPQLEQNTSSEVRIFPQNVQVGSYRVIILGFGSIKTLYV